MPICSLLKCTGLLALRDGFIDVCDIYTRKAYHHLAQCGVSMLKRWQLSQEKEAITYNPPVTYLPTYHLKEACTEGYRLINFCLSLQV